MNKIKVLIQGFFLQFWEKAPGQNWEKMVDLTSKLGEIKDIEHNKDSKIEQNRTDVYLKIPKGIKATRIKNII